MNYTYDNKEQEFTRINAPRVARAVAQVNHIEKSAKSMKIPTAIVAGILSSLQEEMSKFAGVVIPHTTAPDESDSRPTTTPPVLKELTLLKDLSTQQLVDRMIACGAELAGRRK